MSWRPLADPGEGPILNRAVGFAPIFGGAFFVFKGPMPT